jgi:hypothetical protein
MKNQNQNRHQHQNLRQTISVCFSVLFFIALQSCKNEYKVAFGKDYVIEKDVLISASDSNCTNCIKANIKNGEIKSMVINLLYDSAIDSIVRTDGMVYHIIHRNTEYKVITYRPNLLIAFNIDSLKQGWILNSIDTISNIGFKRHFLVGTGLRSMDELISFAILLKDNEINIPYDQSFDSISYQTKKDSMVLNHLMHVQASNSNGFEGMFNYQYVPMYTNSMTKYLMAEYLIYRYGINHN